MRFGRRRHDRHDVVFLRAAAQVTETDVKTLCEPEEEAMGNKMEGFYLFRFFFIACGNRQG